MDKIILRVRAYTVPEGCECLIVIGQKVRGVQLASIGENQFLFSKCMWYFIEKET